jgi:C1A family cysteine protease
VCLRGLYINKMNNPLQALGCIKDKYNPRDILMRGFLKPEKIPERVSLREYAVVRDQSDEGCCVGFATAGVKEYYDSVEYGKQLLFSPRFLYNEAKKIDGMPYEDGTTIACALEVLKTKGVCLEAHWPYVPHQKDEPYISEKQRLIYRAISYARILSVDDLRVSIAQKGPCIVGLQVFKGMMTAAFEGGHVPMPKWYHRSFGGHAVKVCGYDDNLARFEFPNSWGEQVGDKGYFYVSYDYVDRYMVDAWSITDFADPNPLRLGHIRKKAA